MTKGAEAVRRLPTKTDWNCSLRIVAFVGSSWWTDLCLRRGATEAEYCLDYICVFDKCKEVFVLGLEVRSFEATSRISSRYPRVSIPVSLLV